MGKYFGTDGFRGEANRELTAMHALQLGQFLGSFYGSQARRARVVIGKDTRASGYMLEDALCAGLTSAGADAYLLHVTPTPSVSYVARTEGFDCGVMISASHNPYWDNGLKLVNAQGEKMEDAVIERAEAFLDAGASAPLATRERIGRVVDHAAGRNRYIGYLISLATHSYKGLRVGLDCANGSTWQLAESVFKALGAEVTVVGNTPNGENINVNCGSTHIENLQRLVIEHGLDVGFAFDGDADRCIAVDERGQAVDGDRILYLYAAFLQKQGLLGAGHVVTTIMSNMGLYRALDALGIGYEQTDVGDKYVYERIQQRGDPLGGEQSGHIIFAKYATTGDGLLAALQLLRIMREKERPLSELAGLLKLFPQKLVNVRVEKKLPFEERPAIGEAVKKVEAELGDRGRVLLRYSGTESLCRIMVECEDENKVSEYANELADVVARELR